jgi:hypothetical protein
MAVGLSESTTIGILLLLVFGAVCFYLYSRVNYTEKRMGLMENMLLDIKMGLESMNKGEPEFIPEPVGSPRPMETGEAEMLPEVLPEEENYYQSVLQQAGQESELAQQQEVPPQESPSTHEEKAAVSVNYESMTKDDLLALTEKRGAKVGKRPGRKDLITALRKLDDIKSGDISGAGLTSEIFPMAARVGPEGALPLTEGETSGFPVELGAETLE